MDEKLFVKFRWRLEEILAFTTHEVYRNGTIPDNGKMTSIQGFERLSCMPCSTTIFYQLLLANLEDFGFSLKPNYPCVAKYMVKDNQNFILWNVNDLNLSHKDPK